MGGRGSKSSISNSMGSSDVISLNTWNDRIYINGLTYDDKIWIQKQDTGFTENWDIKYSRKSYGLNLAQDYVEHSDSSLYTELEKIKNGKQRTFEELFEYAQKKK